MTRECIVVMIMIIILESFRITNSIIVGLIITIKIT